MLLMELGDLALILISSPRANGPFEPKDVKISQKLTELPTFKGAFSRKSTSSGTSTSF